MKEIFGIISTVIVQSLLLTSAPCGAFVQTMIGSQRYYHQGCGSNHNNNPLMDSSSSSPSLSSCLLQKQSSPRYVAVDRHFSHDIEDKHDNNNSNDNESNSQPTSVNQVQSLWVFVHNLQKERREYNNNNNNNNNNNVNHMADSLGTEQQDKTREKRSHPAKSLVLFLRSHKFQPPPPQDGRISMAATPSARLRPPEIVEPFSRAVVQAIRLASEQGDYKLILNLVEASMDYANGHAIIMPRIFGEAIDGISKTSANNAKLKQIWNLGTNVDVSNYCLMEPLGTFELNIMIKAMASRGKIRAALNLYQEYTQLPPRSTSPKIQHQQLSLTAPDIIHESAEVNNSNSTAHHKTIIINPDPYTLSTIFAALQESITEEEASTSLNISQAVNKTASNTSVGPRSQCWQWNEAMNLLESYKIRQQQQQQQQQSSSGLPPLNNHVFASLLKLNDRIAQVYLPSAHHGPRMAIYLFDSMHKLGISPDVVTCTLIISNLGYQWKTAVNLLYAMKTTPRYHDHHRASSSSGDTRSGSNSDGTSASSSSSTWTLPRPNVYTYSSVITICARCHQYQTAMELLQEMKNDDSLESPNTWVYNAALLATTRSDSLAVLTAKNKAHQYSQQQQQAHRFTPPKPKRNRERLLMALKLLREMQHEDENVKCQPDTVTYNTVLATLDGIAGPSEPCAVAMDELAIQFASLLNLDSSATGVEESFEERSVHSLMDEMERHKIMRDSITFRNALLAVRFSNNIRASVLRILDRALLDRNALGLMYLEQRQGRQSGRSDANAKARQLEGKAADGVTFVFDTAMTILASHGDVEGVLQAFAKMMEQSTTRSRILAERISGAQIHFVQSLGSATKSSCTSLIPLFLDATKGDNLARLEVTKWYPSIDFRLFADNRKSESLYSAAISSCLGANDIQNARKVLSMMRGEGLQPSELSLQEIVRTYARLAVMGALEETKNATPQQSGDRKLAKQDLLEEAEAPYSPLVESQDSGKANNYKALAQTRATNAYNIATKTLTNPPSSLLSTVARTCASVGMWREASKVLKSLHRRIQGEACDLSSIGATQAVLPGLHRSLLRASSIQGNVTAALWFVDDIQKISNKMRISARQQREEEDQLLSNSGDLGSMLSNYDAAQQETLGMSAEDWKLLMIAAAKCGHWRVCLSTLQFLRPFVEETHPSSLSITVEERSRRYSHLAPALSVAVKCLEVRGQYAWAIRAIDDWIEWSGRRPHKAAVLSAIRILSARGRGALVNNLLARCTQGDGAALLSYGNDKSYEMILYVGAITALHNEGLYDDADDAFIAAVKGKFLPFDIHSEDVDGKQRTVLDLHGMNVPVAHSAVRVALQQQVEVASWTKKKGKLTARESSILDNDMVIVTGRGRNSALRMRPVLRPEVQRMLLEEFYPPLSTTSIPGNMGALSVPATDINSWLVHQRKQKGKRMLAVASVLRNVSSMDRLRQIVAKKIQAEEASKKQVDEESE